MPEKPPSQPNPTGPILEYLAKQIAGSHSPVQFETTSLRVKTRLEAYERILRDSYAYLNEASQNNKETTYAAEWVLDNYYVVEQAIRQVRRDLPEGYLNELPKLETPSGTYPRVYSLALLTLIYSGYKPDDDQLKRFLKAYQQVNPLTIGEVWAIPIMLRAGILEGLSNALAHLTNLPFKRDAFVEETEKGIPHEPVSDDTMVMNGILTLRMLAVQSWKEFFESTNLVEQTLRNDPAGVYAKMDFETRDRYRMVIENLAQSTDASEVEIAEHVIALATQALQQHQGLLNPHRTAHVGYYLIDEGLEQIEADFIYRPPVAARFRRWVLHHPLPVYLGSILLLTLVFWALAIGYAFASQGSQLLIFMTALLTCLPASAVAVNIIHWLITRFIPPRILPKYDFSNGIPEGYQSMVVIPCILRNQENVRRLLNQLETHYLGNIDPQLRFALLSDFADASQETMPEDDELLRQTQDGIHQLNARYGRDSIEPFYLFHRKRVWNPAENCWMGWERKRGKLEEFNRLLLGGKPTTIVTQYGELNLLPKIKYVITLDSDTTLPRESAGKLIATLSHPLNRAEVDMRTGKVKHGYTVLQPRVQVRPAITNQSLFARIYSGDTNLDLYTRAVSDVYQDLFGEGNYIGKGIYDVSAFDHCLSERVPENSLLSHDLFEGILGRCGLATDIVLFEDYPPHYLAYSGRLERWVRGDWQLLPWLLPRIPHRTKGHIPSDLSGIGRWKILDNLRRSLLTPALFLLLVCAWSFLPGSALVWTVVGILSLSSALPLNLITYLLERFRRPMLTQTHQSISNELGRIGFHLVFLAHETGVNLRSIGNTLTRVFFTHRKLLEWTSSSYMLSLFGEELQFERAWIEMAFSPLVSILLAVLLVFVNRSNLFLAMPFLLAWFLAPQIAAWLGHLPKPYAQTLSSEQNHQLHRLARATWLFFERFVDPADHWLPPDHFQEDPLGLIAHRTSPTNIGLMMLSTLAAYDFGFIGPMGLSLRLNNTFDVLDGLEHHRGHLLNWYDTRTLEPLPPRYVSTVDSGNLAGCLLALEQGCLEIPQTELLNWNGFLDTLEILSESIAVSGLGAVAKPALEYLERIQREVLTLRDDPKSSFATLVKVSEHERDAFATNLIELVEKTDQPMDSQVLHQLSVWTDRVRQQLLSIERRLDMLSPWMIALGKPPELFAQQGLDPKIRDLWQALQAETPRNPHLNDLPELHKSLEVKIAQLQQMLSFGKGDDWRSAQTWCQDLLQKMGQTCDSIKPLLYGFQDLSRRAHKLVEEMDFTFLFDRQRQVFHIGYNIESGKLDENYYDLLASESRLASLVAIAKDDIPQSHWLYLARPLNEVNGSRTLLSWSGTMFEFLMPALLVRSYPHTLLDQSCRVAIQHQIDYGEQKKVPWGISESSFYQFDANQVYQYRAFGVPGLGIKRGLADDLVITPYACLLALPFIPQAVMQNIDRLNDAEMYGIYGFYESADFTPERLKSGSEKEIIRSFMAHHQGMIFLALANYLLDERMVNRFHANPIIQSIDLLLQEQLSNQALIDRPRPRQIGAMHTIQSRAALVPWVPLTGVTPSQVHILSNGSYSLLITSQGNGYSRWQELDLTRWRADTTRDGYGLWVYLKDLDQNLIWSAGSQPIHSQPDSQQVRFFPHQVIFERREHHISMQMMITVPPEDDLEIRLVTLANLSNQNRRIAVTTYGEVVLSAHNADQRHPAFNKLFVESETLVDEKALLFRRRLRAENEQPAYLAHSIVLEHENGLPIRYETSRERFLGRDGFISQPNNFKVMSRSLPTDTPLDPIFSIHRILEMKPYETVQFAILTIAADGRRKTEKLVHRYRDWPRILRSFDRTRIATEQEFERFNLNSTLTESAQQVLSNLLYPHASLRSNPGVLAKNKLGQPGLWAFSISGDFPILLVQVEENDDLRLVRDVLRTHAFWRRRNVMIDLVIMNMFSSDYEQAEHQKIKRLVTNGEGGGYLNQRGGVFILMADQMSEEERILLETTARVVLNGAHGSFAEQAIKAHSHPLQLPYFSPPGYITKYMDARSELERPTDLIFDNGLGGFTPDGKEYVIYLSQDQTTPAPWTNVIANPKFGFLVTEAGLGSTWAVNSGENRLTSWHNDPVADPPGEAIYLRDEETGQIWSPTPLPARDPEPYLIRHGAGYSIFEHHYLGLKQRLSAFAAPDEPVKIVQLHLENTTEHTRRITVTYYAEWVLGTSHEDTMQYLVPEFDSQNHALLVRNSYSIDFHQRVAFLAATRELHGLTADRTEFLGHMGYYNRPEGLVRVGLSVNVEAGNDPCAAIQVLLWLAPGETKEVSFLLGQGANRSETLDLIKKYQNPDHIEAALKAVNKTWDQMLETIQVHTPEPSIDILLNRWMLYQDLSCRFWGRTAFYQSSGAYGFRDQLQDAMGLVYARPDLIRQHILDAASHQFEEGDVLHWWHPPVSRGIRTRISDDMLWLPFVTAFYVNTSGDADILRENVPFLSAPSLGDDENERYGQFPYGKTEGSLYEHCCRAIEKGATQGKHHLPLFGTGDWNDGMNRVGIEGEGESVWLGWFLNAVMNDFAPLCDYFGDHDRAERFRQKAEAYRIALEGAWDGKWYRRGYYDDGWPLGSSQNSECQIDSIAQSWAVLSGAVQSERAQIAMDSVFKKLVQPEDQLLLLFTPPFDRTVRDPGYIKGYLPGIRENGGQYTHAALWNVGAFARLGQGGRTTSLYQLLNPILHADTPEKIQRYRVEPYVIAGDVYSSPEYHGRGGWTWYTGSAGWAYRLGLEELLGFKRLGDHLEISPCIPKDWSGFEITYHFGNATYHIVVQNPEQVERGIRDLQLDGKAIEGGIPLVDDGKSHSVQVTMGS